MRVLRIIAIFCFVVFVLLLFPVNSKAANEFSSTYDTTYSVFEDGNTEVEQDITLTNLTDKFFPSSFTLIVPAIDINDIRAADKQGALETQSSNDGKNTKIVVTFSNQQIIGSGKQYNFTLNFRDNSIARHSGKIWTVNIPKLNNASDIETFNLNLSVPSSFDDPDFISVPPAGSAESGGRIKFSFEKNILFNKGVSAIFGNNQLYKFESIYHLSNNSLFPRYIATPLSVESSYQKTFINSVEPRPENTEIDENGILIAVFKVNSGQILEVKASGNIQLSLNPANKAFLSTAEREAYLKGSKYSDASSPVVKGKAAEILETKRDAQLLEEAEEIDQYVSNFLKFATDRYNQNDFLRFGSITALNNPEKALTAEYVDLEIALLRSVGIPARQVIGFSTPQGEKPFAYQNKNLHSWVEIYTDETGWVTADPAWENTTGGEDLFNFNDLSHLALATGDGKDFVLPSEVKVELSDGEAQEIKAVELDVQIQEEILSGFNNKLVVTINNLGNAVFPADTLKIDSSKILIQGNNNASTNAVLINTPPISPFGSVKYEFDLKTGAIWHSYQDAIQISFAGATDTRLVTIKPVLSYRIYAVEITGALIMIILFYIATFLLHRKSIRND